MQVPVVLAPPPQVAPAATHIPPTQQPPPVQVLDAQQAWPAVPQTGPAAPPTPGVPVLPPLPVVVEPPAPVLIVEVLLPHAARINDSDETIRSAGNAPRAVEERERRAGER